MTTTTMTHFEQYTQRKQAEHGSKFSSTGLAPQFIPYYNTGARIEVAFVNANGEEYERKRGRIGATTGWKPCFLLMLTKRSTGSSYTLGAKDKVIKVVAT